MKRLFFVLAATVMAAAMGPAAAMTTAAATVSAAATTTAITLKPTAGLPTTTVTAHGIGFGPGETVTVDFDTTLAATATTSTAGSSTTSLKVPGAALPGRHTVTATGQASNLSAHAHFWVRTNWAKFRFSDRNSGFNPYENVLSPANVAGLTKAWSVRTGGPISYSSPAVVNGVVYGGSGNGSVYALNAATGAKLWSYPTGTSVFSSPAV
ncbi:MAG: PQQ-binding-like beta-propeller repeat protein, partial [Streptosporangiaceae bacterium]